MRKLFVLIMSMVVILTMAACTDDNDIPVDDVSKTGTEITDALSFIKNVTPEYIKDKYFSGKTEKDKDGNVVSSNKILSDLLNNASKNIVDEPKGWYDEYKFEWPLERWISYDADEIPIESIDLRCNEAEYFVEVNYMKDDAHSTIFVNDPELYEYVRYRDCYEPEVDEEEYAKYIEILGEKDELPYDCYDENLGAKKRELLKFLKIYEYNEEDGKTVKIYDMESAIICENPDTHYAVGGQHFDGKLRLRHCPMQFIVRLDGDRIVAHTGLGVDLYFNEESLKDGVYKEFVMKEITNGLDRNEALSKN